MAVFLSRIKAWGYLDQVHITMCNVGSRKINADDCESTGWSIFAPHLTVYGFDADPEACQAANQDIQSRKVPWQEYHWPLALGERQEKTQLYITREPSCSSLHPPDQTFTSRFFGFNSSFQLSSTMEVETTTLDQFVIDQQLGSVDFLQVDVQGADLAVLKGSEQTITQHVLAIKVEVEFTALYQDQPLFAQVDSYLRGLGFQLFDLDQSNYWCRPRRACSPLESQRRGQLLWADALYLRDPLLEAAPPQDQDPDRIFRLACFADIFGFPDYALELLHHLTLTTDDERYNFAELIVEALADFEPLLAAGLEHLPVVQSIGHRLPEIYEFPTALP